MHLIHGGYRQPAKPETSTGLQPSVSLQGCTPYVPVNPCKGGRANWKICKNTRKTGTSSENNRGEQGKNREICGFAWWGAVAITASSLFQPGLDVGATRAGRLAAFYPPEIASLFPSAGNGTLFHSKKPGAVTRPGLRITPTDIYFYMKLVTCVKREVGAGEGACYWPGAAPALATCLQRKIQTGHAFAHGAG